MAEQNDDKGMTDMMFNPLTMPLALAQAAITAWMPIMNGNYWRTAFSDISHPDHGDFRHGQLEVPVEIEDDGERNLFA